MAVTYKTNTYLLAKCNAIPLLQVLARSHLHVRVKTLYEAVSFSSDIFCISSETSSNYWYITVWISQACCYGNMHLDEPLCSSKKPSLRRQQCIQTFIIIIRTLGKSVPLTFVALRIRIGRTIVLEIILFIRFSNVPFVSQENRNLPSSMVLQNIAVKLNLSCLFDEAV